MQSYISRLKLLRKKQVIKEAKGPLFFYFRNHYSSIFILFWKAAITADNDPDQKHHFVVHRNILIEQWKTQKTIAFYAPLPHPPPLALALPLSLSHSLHLSISPPLSRWDHKNAIGPGSLPFNSILVLTGSCFSHLKNSLCMFLVKTALDYFKTFLLFHTHARTHTLSHFWHARTHTHILSLFLSRTFLFSANIIIICSQLWNSI